MSRRRPGSLHGLALLAALSIASDLADAAAPPATETSPPSPAAASAEERVPPPGMRKPAPALRSLSREADRSRSSVPDVDRKPEGPTGLSPNHANGTAVSPTARSAVAEGPRVPSEPAWSIPILEASVLFTGMRVTEAYLWPDPFSFRRVGDWPEAYTRAYTMPPKFDSSRPFMTWDGDRWQINVIGHGLLGSELYLRPRRCGFGLLGSLGFATVSSAAWEYAFEANGVRPSGVDLWFTPLSGLILGEARFQAWRAAGGIRESVFRLLVQSVLDPLGEFSSAALGLGC